MIISLGQLIFITITASFKNFIIITNVANDKIYCLRYGYFEYETCIEPITKRSKLLYIKTLLTLKINLSLNDRLSIRL